jgi:hypothetical protein
MVAEAISWRSAEMASFFISTLPLLATMTGSMTSGTSFASAGAIAFAMARMISAE